ncbi:MAG: hypothetical protein ACRD1K_21300 [Acidimicrobiales bacterium]
MRVALRRDDDYASADKPAVRLGRPRGQEAPVDSLVRAARAALAALDGEELAARGSAAAASTAAWASPGRHWRRRAS